MRGGINLLVGAGTLGCSGIAEEGWPTLDGTRVIDGTEVYYNECGRMAPRNWNEWKAVGRGAWGSVKGCAEWVGSFVADSDAIREEANVWKETLGIEDSSSSRPGYDDGYKGNGYYKRSDGSYAWLYRDVNGNIAERCY